MNQHLHQHYIICKPDGYLSQFINNQSKRNNKKLLGDLGDFPEKTMAIDGKVSEYIRSSKIEKEYYAQVDGIITEQAIVQLKKGVDIGINGTIYLTKESEVHRVLKLPHLPIRKKKIRDDRHGPTSWVSVTLREGKFRQVRKMTAAVGFPTLRLVRVRIGNIHLGSMNAGDIIEVSSFEDA
jgi:23S rRNA pseudouridine2457 synthase